MFIGGLNGDGFFNEEYADGGYESGEGCNFGYESPTDIKDLDLVKTGVETDKAVQYMFRDFGNIWMPKKALTKPHFEGIEGWGIKILHKNIKKLITDLKEGQSNE